MAILCHNYKVSVVPIDDALVSLQAIGSLETNVISSETEGRVAFGTAEDGLVAF